MPAVPTISNKEKIKPYKLLSDKGGLAKLVVAWNHKLEYDENIINFTFMKQSKILEIEKLMNVLDDEVIKSIIEEGAVYQTTRSERENNQQRVVQSESQYYVTVAESQQFNEDMKMRVGWNYDEKINNWIQIISTTIPVDPMKHKISLLRKKINKLKSEKKYIIDTMNELQKDIDDFQRLNIPKLKEINIDVSLSKEDKAEKKAKYISKMHTMFYYSSLLQEEKVAIIQQIKKKEQKIEKLDKMNPEEIREFDEYWSEVVTNSENEFLIFLEKIPGIYNLLIRKKLITKHQSLGLLHNIDIDGQEQPAEAYSDYGDNSLGCTVHGFNFFVGKKDRKLTNIINQRIWIDQTLVDLEGLEILDEVKIDNFLLFNKYYNIFFHELGHAFNNFLVSSKEEKRLLESHPQPGPSKPDISVPISSSIPNKNDNDEKQFSKEHIQTVLNAEIKNFLFEKFKQHSENEDIENAETETDAELKKLKFDDMFSHIKETHDWNQEKLNYFQRTLMGWIAMPTIYASFNADTKFTDGEENGDNLIQNMQKIIFMEDNKEFFAELFNFWLEGHYNESVERTIFWDWIDDFFSIRANQIFQDNNLNELIKKYQFELSEQHRIKEFEMQTRIITSEKSKLDEQIDILKLQIPEFLVRNYMTNIINFFRDERLGLCNTAINFLIEKIDETQNLLKTIIDVTREKTTLESMIDVLKLSDSYLDFKNIELFSCYFELILNIAHINKSKKNHKAALENSDGSIDPKLEQEIEQLYKDQIDEKKEQYKEVFNQLEKELKEFFEDKLQYFSKIIFKNYSDNVSLTKLNQLMTTFKEKYGDGVEWKLNARFQFQGNIDALANELETVPIPINKFSKIKTNFQKLKNDLTQVLDINSIYNKCKISMEAFEMFDSFNRHFNWLKNSGWKLNLENNLPENAIEILLNNEHLLIENPNNVYSTKDKNIKEILKMLLPGVTFQDKQIIEQIKNEINKHKNIEPEKTEDDIKSNIVIGTLMGILGALTGAVVAGTTATTGGVSAVGAGFESLAIGISGIINKIFSAFPKPFIPLKPEVSPPKPPTIQKPKVIPQKPDTRVPISEVAPSQPKVEPNKPIENPPHPQPRPSKPNTRVPISEVVPSQPEGEPNKPISAYDMVEKDIQDILDNTSWDFEKNELDKINIDMGIEQLEQLPNPNELEEPNIANRLVKKRKRIKEELLSDQPYFDNSKHYELPFNFSLLVNKTKTKKTNKGKFDNNKKNNSLPLISNEESNYWSFFVVSIILSVFSGLGILGFFKLKKRNKSIKKKKLIKKKNKSLLNTPSPPSHISEQENQPFLEKITPSQPEVEKPGSSYNSDEEGLISDLEEYLKQQAIKLRPGPSKPDTSVPIPEVAVEMLT